jgi:hypothetical protein
MAHFNTSASGITAGFGASPSVITDNTSIFQVDDRTGLMVLPYGLAAHLLLNEDQNRAAYFNNRYDELKRKKKAVITKIKDVYGIVPQETAPSTTTTDQQQTTNLFMMIQPS